jgi:GNAT superfamily N-acetyltransferase
VEPVIRAIEAEEWPAAARLVGRALWDEPYMRVTFGEDRLARYAATVELFLALDPVGKGRPAIGAFAGDHPVAVAVATEPASCPYCAPPQPGAPVHAFDIAFREVDARLRAAHLGLAPHWRIAPVAAEPGLQGIGLGRLVVEAVVAEAMAREPALMTLECAPHVVPFYERLGFGVHADVSGGAIELVSMVRDPAGA